MHPPPPRLVTGDLPISAVLDSIADAVRTHPITLVQADPGAGKTSLVPGYVLDHCLQSDQRMWLIQPRRLAARATARRIAALRGTLLGQEVGYHVRFDPCYSRHSRLIVMTEGMALRRLQAEAGENQLGCVVLDEFHERSLDADLVLGLLRQLQHAWPVHLKIVIMSATLDAAALQQQLQPCAAITCPGRQYPVEVRYQRGFGDRDLEQQVAAVLPQALQDTPGHVLVFLPGVGAIHRTHRVLQPWAAREGVEVHDLYGDMPPEDQDRVLTGQAGRKVILATNVAETSITVEGVTAVIDSGLMKTLRTNPETGLARLETSSVSQASAAQRAGRAGRTAPGICWRLWNLSEERYRAEHLEPEVLRCDLSSALLQLLAWGERDLAQFPWLTPPPSPAIDSARHLLEQLGATAQGELTELGRVMSHLPVEPRVARILVEGHRWGVLPEAALVCAMLTEPDPFRVSQSSSKRRGARPETVEFRSDSDVVDRVEALQAWAAGVSGDGGRRVQDGAARNVMRVARELERLVLEQLGPQTAGAGELPGLLRRAIWVGFPDRIARRRERLRPRAVMVGGKGVRLAPSSAVRSAEFFVCVEVQDAQPEAWVRVASAVDVQWLDPRQLQTAEEVFFHPSLKQLVARRRTYWNDLLIAETPTAIEDWSEAARVLSTAARQHWREAFPHDSPALMAWIDRLQWLRSQRPDLELPDWSTEQLQLQLQRLVVGCRSLAELRAADWLGILSRELSYQQRQALEQQAPEKITLSNGRTVKLNYQTGKPPILSVRIQDLFGVQHTPRVAGGAVPVLLHLLGPNQRLQQVTDDLEHFWRRTYPDVRKQLRGRYPKHPWPEDPLSPIS